MPTRSAASPVLSYVRSGALPARPGRLAALAVVSLIVGAAAFLLGVFNLAFFAAILCVEPPREKPVSPAPIPAVSLAAYDGDPAGPHGLHGLRRAQRDAIVEHLRERLKLSPDRAEMLDRLLADVGARIFASTAFDPSQVKEAGQRGGGADGAGPRGSHWFITNRGVVEISDASATFTPDGASPVRVEHNTVREGDAPPRWSALAIGRCIDEVYVRSGGQPTSLQAAALLEILRRQTVEAFDVPSKSWAHRPQVRDVTFGSDGALLFALDDLGTRKRWILVDGRSVDFAQAPLGVDPLTGIPRTPRKLIDCLYWPGPRAAIAAFAAHGLFGALAGAYLFAGAARLLRRDAYAGATRHARFILMQVPLLAVSIVTIVVWARSLRDYAASPLPVEQWWLVSGWTIAGMLAYVVMSACVLGSRRARHYHLVLGIDPWAPVRECVISMMRGALARRSGAMLVILALAHAAIAMWCLMLTGDPDARGLQHLLGGAIAGAIGAVLLRMNPPRSAMFALLVLAIPILSGAQSPVSPFAIEGLLRRARGPAGDDAVAAVRELARSRGAGQAGLLQLLEGPEPPIGIDRIVEIVGEEWFDREVSPSRVLWAPQYRPRALRLTLEWVDSIRRADRVSSIAILEAMGDGRDIEPLLRPLLTARQDAICRRAAEFVLRINPRPTGMVGLLRRDLDDARHPQQKQQLIKAMTYLRPASDPLLARLLGGTDESLASGVMSAMLGAQQPLSDEMLDAVVPLANHESPHLHRPALRLMRLSEAGRAHLIERAIVRGRASDVAQEVLAEHWPDAKPVFWRLSDAQSPDERRAIELAARAVLAQLNEQQQGVAQLEQMTAGTDPELAAQASMVLARGQYASRLGPQTYRLIEPHLNRLPRPSEIRPQWGERDPAPAAAGAVSAPPMWLSLSVWLLSLATPLILAVASLQRTWNCGKDAQESEAINRLPD